ncbi:MAG: SPW repeat protein [Candidatus Colwellbacteria bacterium]|nr:SPW repeat protein [Candidatus Colwellbacteria bacterium]
MEKMRQTILEWLILAIGAWIMISPIVLGAAGTLVFYSNILTGAFLIIIALKGLTSNGKKI